MPLILLTGYPSSGKTTRAQQLKEYFSTVVGKNVVVLSENDIVKNKHIYSGMKYSFYDPIYYVYILDFTIEHYLNLFIRCKQGKRIEKYFEI